MWWFVITVANVNWFFKIISLEGSCGNVLCIIIKTPTSPTVCCYTTLSDLETKNGTNFIGLFITLDSCKYHCQRRHQHFNWCSLSVISVVNMCYCYVCCYRRRPGGCDGQLIGGFEDWLRIQRKPWAQRRSETSATSCRRSAEFHQLLENALEFHSLLQRVISSCSSLSHVSVAF